VPSFAVIFMIMGRRVDLPRTSILVPTNRGTVRLLLILETFADRARGTFLAILVTWVVLAQVIGIDLRPDPEDVAATPGSHAWWRRSIDASAGDLAASVTSPRNICAHLASHGKREENNVIRWSKRNFAALQTTHQPVLVVLLVSATDGGNYWHAGHMRSSHGVGGHDSHGTACTRAAASAQLLRNSQTLGDLDVNVIFVDAGGKAVGGRPMSIVCPGIEHFHARTLSAGRRPETSAPELGTATAPSSLGSSAGPWDFLVLVDATKPRGTLGLHATTLEKLLLAMKSRHVEIVSSARSSGTTANAGEVVCITPPRIIHPNHQACKMRGAPVLLRVPVWLSTRELDKWAAAAIELIGSISVQNDKNARAENDALSSLFCAGSEKAVAVHSLREHQLLVGVGIRQSSRRGGHEPDACPDASSLHPSARAAHAALSAAYNVEHSRDQRLADAYDRRRSDDKLASPRDPGFMLIVPWLDHGGVDQFNVNLARTLTRLGIRVVVVTTLSSEHPTARDFYAVTPDIFHLPHLIASPRDTPGVINVLTHLVTSRNVQVIMISHSSLGYNLLSHLRNALAATGHGHVRFVDFVHLEEMEWGDGGYAAMSVSRAGHLDHTFAASKHVAAWMRERGRQVARESIRREQQQAISKRENGWGEHRISVAYIGVDTRALRPMSLPERAKVRSEMLQPLGKINTATPVIAYIARMVDQKLPELYFEIVRQLREDRQVEFLSLAIGDGPKLAELRANISQHLLLNRTVLTLGMLDHNSTIRALAAADVLLLPSQNEGISLAVYEAMSLGVSPVVSAVGGQCELVADGSGACLPLDLAGAKAPADILLAAEPFVDDLQRILSSRELMSRRSQTARQRVESEFDIASTVLALSRGLCDNGLVI
jgi:glycosyltransferase involved in cell wall biosynthesis